MAAAIAISSNTMVKVTARQAVGRRFCLPPTHAVETLHGTDLELTGDLRATIGKTIAGMSRALASDWHEWAARHLQIDTPTRTVGYPLFRKTPRPSWPDDKEASRMVQPQPRSQEGHRASRELPARRQCVRRVGRRRRPPWDYPQRSNPPSLGRLAGR